MGRTFQLRVMLTQLLHKKTNPSMRVEKTYYMVAHEKRQKPRQEVTPALKLSHQKNVAY